MKFLKWFGIIILSLVIIYLIGPRPSSPKINPDLPVITSDLLLLEQDIKNSEANVKDIKPDNYARIIWSNPEKKEKTTYSVVYLHGFSASYAEGAPINLDFAKRYGCNLYLSRLEEHGISNTHVFENLTPEALLLSAKRALAIGKKLGDKVILICTSTGGTLGLYLAAHHSEVDALILYFLAYLK